jgi:hypothetical protein
MDLVCIRLRLVVTASPSHSHPNTDTIQITLQYREKYLISYISLISVALGVLGRLHGPRL